ncbi:MAG: SDR family oxidoreductase, partial [Chloroflexi bacterium]|nr:SDR family oxidoreductase [Chloroflexota bacterium]
MNIDIKPVPQALYGTGTNLLKGKKALISGSRRGIGAEIARTFAENGADVGINDVERDAEADKTLAAIKKLGRKASWHQADIGDAKQRDRMFDEFLKEHGRVDILVNNAVRTKWTPFLELEEADWDHQIGHALKGYVFCAKRAANEMVRQGGGGRIISISSVHSFRAWPRDTIYGIVKAGLNRLVLSMAVDLAGTGITANCIAPGYIDSRVLTPEQEPNRAGRGYADHAIPLIPARRGGVPRDIANTALFLASDLSSYVNGETILVDG